MLNADPCLSDVIGALMAQIAVLFVMAAGFCIMFGMNELAARLFFTGILLVIAVGIVPTHQDGELGTVLGTIVTWAAILGLCALILAAPRVGAVLAAPAFLLLMVWPIVATMLRGLPIWWIVPAVAVVLIIVGFRKLLPEQERARVRIDTDTERVRDLLRSGRSTTEQFRPTLQSNLRPENRPERTARKHLEDTNT